jgi:PPOX class probable F420-dependent enzyme
VELSERAIETRLAREARAVLATLRADGSAALVPIVFARVGDALWSPIDGKPKRASALARLAHIAREPRVSVLLDAYGEDWSRLWWLRVEGTARIEHCDVPRAEAALRAKYPQYAATPLYAAEAVLLRIELARVTSWAASTEAVRAAEEDR